MPGGNALPRARVSFNVQSPSERTVWLPPRSRGDKQLFDTREHKQGCFFLLFLFLFYVGKIKLNFQWEKFAA